MADIALTSLELEDILSAELDDVIVVLNTAMKPPVDASRKSTNLEAAIKCLTVNHRPFIVVLSLLGFRLGVNSEYLRSSESSP